MSNDISHLDFPVAAELSEDFDQLDAKLDAANDGLLVRVRRIKPKAEER
jgi:hypothetical protein